MLVFSCSSLTSPATTPTSEVGNKGVVQGPVCLTSTWWTCLPQLARALSYTWWC